MNCVFAAFFVLLLPNMTAQAQYVLDNNGRPYKCLPYDTNCQTLPPPGTPLQPLNSRAAPQQQNTDVQQFCKAYPNDPICSTTKK